MDLAFFAADTLGVTLYQIRSRLVATEVHPLQWEPWRLEMSVDVESDILSGTELGFWVTLGKTLRLYVVIREKANWLLVLNTAQLQACGKATGFAASTVKERILEFKPAVQGVFRWRDGHWASVQYDGATMGA